jgi:hypothetical protein
MLFNVKTRVLICRFIFPLQDAFLAGQHFAKHFPQSMSHVNNMETPKQQQEILVQEKSQAKAIVGGSSVGSTVSSSFVARSVLAGFHLSKANLLRRSNGSVAKKECQEEVHQFMRGIMDECTHLRNFSVPVDTELIIAVAAQADGYVPRDDCAHLTDIWPDAEVRYLDAGHVSAFLLYQKMFR